MSITKRFGAPAQRTISSTTFSSSASYLQRSFCRQFTSNTITQRHPPTLMGVPFLQTPLSSVSAESSTGNAVDGCDCSSFSIESA
ncbi:hypothetical protein K1719_035162 [Acacia pycnantha]|nr:hypothetical protein K1719_035162 [Acacia pycnantha]